MEGASRLVTIRFIALQVRLMLPLTLLSSKGDVADCIGHEEKT